MHNWGRVPTVQNAQLGTDQLALIKIIKGCLKMEIVFKMIGIIIIAIGIVCVYDARKLTQKFFSTSDTNTATRNLKIVGFIIAVIGCAIFIFAK